jgi:uncharacterized delta-60 repeat protein
MYKLITKTIFISLLALIGLSIGVNAQTPGSNDNTFNPTDIGFGYGDGPNDYVKTTAIQSNGKILIGGQFTSYTGISRNHIARLNADGTLDTTFNVGTGANGLVNTISIQSDGKIIIGGDFTSYNGVSRNYITRLNTDGTLDATFNIGTGPSFIVNTTAIQSNGKIIIGGQFNSYNGINRNYFARLNTDGTLDQTVDVGTGASYIVNTTAIQSDGKIIIGGQFAFYNGTSRNYIARLNTDGTLDVTFNVGTGANVPVATTSIQSDGKIIIGGQFTSYNGTSSNCIARLNTNGTLDNTFNIGTGSNYYVRTTALQSDGKIIIAGDFDFYNGTSISRIARLNSNGTLDTIFNVGSGANSYVYTTAIQSDGKIIIGGYFNTYNQTNRNYITRLNIDGTLDTSFNVGTGADFEVSTTALQSDGKIIIGGRFTSYNGTSIKYIARLYEDGALDTTFNLGIGANNIVGATAIQSDGKIIIGGGFTHYNGISRGCIARLNTDGTLDTTFNVGIGATFSILTIAIQSDGKIIIGGAFTSYDGVARSRIARLNTDGTLDVTFNVGTGANGVVRTCTIQSNGKIIIGGDFNSYNGNYRNHIASLNTDGTLDGTFNVGSGAYFRVITSSMQSDGKIIIGGDFTAYNGTLRNRIARINTDGTSDNTFNVGTGASNGVYTTAIQSDGKIIIGGNFTAYNGINLNGIARLNNNGTLDFTFNVGSGANGSVVSSSIQSNGKIIISGGFTSYNGHGRNRIARIIIDSTQTVYNPQSICQGSTYTFNGSIYSNQGNYTDTIQTLVGNDSIIITQLTVNQLPFAAGSIIGSASVCQGQNSVTYTVPTITDATSYIWTLPSGATGTSATNSITVDYGISATSGNITVKGNNSCGDGTTSTLAITVNPLPVAAGTIMGSATVCQGQNSVTYTVPTITDATSYIWTLPSGATGTSATNSITVDYGISATSGNITVKGNNSCGDGTTSTLAITVSPLPVAAGTIMGSATVCQGQNSVTYTVQTITDATSYIWTLPSGATGTSATNSITVDYSISATSGNITVKGNNSCGDGTTSTLAITVNLKPTTPIISLNGLALLSNAVNGNQWYDQNGLIIGATNQNFNVSNAGVYYVMVTLNNCSSDTSNNITINITGFEFIEANSNIKVYPNPVSNELIIEIDGNNEKVNFDILNAVGQVLFKGNLVKKTTVQTSNFVPGVYLIKLENGKTFEFKKIIKE